MRCFVWAAVAIAAVLFVAPVVASEESAAVEERLRRLERLVEAQQRALSEKDKQIGELQTGMGNQAKMAEKLAQIESGTYFQTDAAKPADNTFKVFWKEGLKFETADKAFSLALGGRIYNDWGWYSESDEISDIYGEQEDQAYFRAARLEFGGTIYKNTFFKAQYDFSSNAQGSDEFKDVYLGLKNLPWIGTMTIGQFKMPMGLEELTSSKYITFMERSAPTQAFSPSRHVGVQFNNNHFDERLTWAVAAYKLANRDAAFAQDDQREKIIFNNSDPDTDDGFDFRPSDGQANWAIGTRLTGTPYYADKDKLVHLGLAYQWQHLASKDARIRIRPENRMSASVIDTGLLPANDRHLFGAEVAMVYERWSFQAEWMGSWLERGGLDNYVHDSRIETNGGYNFDIGTATQQTVTPTGLRNGGEIVDMSGADDSLFMHGFYLMGSVFVTDDARHYKKSSGAFDRVKPKHNFDGKGGWGALELAGRLSYLDLDDGQKDDVDGDGDETGREDRLNEVRGGSAWIATAGLNWYLNPNMRWMFNYSVANYRANDIVAQGGVDRAFVQGTAEPDDRRADGHVNTFAMRFQVDF
ncbi:MAG: hypothetical protein HS116_04870 [Planctomycetes bacterium]|nr:hypothetical protein [Planctomycetota bacterium]